MHIVLLACGLWVFTGPHPLEEKDEGSTDRQQLLCIVCVCVWRNVQFQFKKLPLGRTIPGKNSKKTLPCKFCFLRDKHLLSTIPHK